MSANIEKQPFTPNAYVSYHGDGLVDLFIGIGALGFGLGILFDLPWIGAIIPREEQMMMEQLGDEYRAYMQRTGRFLPRM